jgi:choline dehydrogenase-like flavoprotein
VERFDVIIIGTGAGGGTLAHALASTGKRILLLERGDFVRREKANWDPRHPKTSALDVNCRAREVNNLYVVDGSFFPSSAAVNPALTIIANALRVGDHLRARLS